MTLNQRVQGSNPCAPTIDPIQQIQLSALEHLWASWVVSWEFLAKLKLTALAELESRGYEVRGKNTQEKKKKGVQRNHARDRG